jgi:hypothetical protein
MLHCRRNGSCYVAVRVEVKVYGSLVGKVEEMGILNTSLRQKTKTG